MAHERPAYPLRALRQEPDVTWLSMLPHEADEQATLPADLWQYARYPARVAFYALATYNLPSREPGLP